MKKAAKYLGRLAAEKRKEDETKMSKEDYFAKIEHSMQQAENGECVCFDNQEAMNAWLKKL
ncbi:MAG: hypothetical protein NC324_07470 [Bacteroides sp.]|nr:hypothetical protein [Bacteroides sp.]